MENEIYMVMFILFFPLFIFIISFFFHKRGWIVTNYMQIEIPYSLGFCLLVAIYIYGRVIAPNNINLAFFYLTLIWLIGFIDDTLGTKYPKGLKGHIRYLVVQGKISTGIIKIVGTVVISLVTTWLLEPSSFLDSCRYFLLLVFTPHVMNLFDTRPLRVWKLVGVNSVFFIPLIYELSQFLALIFLVIPLIYFEGKRKAMLGDSGATLLGGALAFLIILHLHPYIQTVMLLLYTYLIFIAEKVSLSQIIEDNALLRKLDRWGVS